MPTSLVQSAADAEAKRVASEAGLLIRLALDRAGRTDCWLQRFLRSTKQQLDNGKWELREING